MKVELIFEGRNHSDKSKQILKMCESKHIYTCIKIDTDIHQKASSFICFYTEDRSELLVEVMIMEALQGA